MPDGHALLLCALASIGLLLVPGPAVLYIVTRSVSQGREAGLVSVLGIHAGSVVHVAAAAVGLSALLASSATAFSAVKYAGAAYLVYLGIRRLLERGEEEWTPARSRRRLFWEGAVVNVLNPKTAVFFLALLPQFVDPEQGAVALQIAVLGFCFILLGMVSDGAYALFAGAAGRLLRGSEHARRRLAKLSGCVYIGLGATTALAGRATTD